LIAVIATLATAVYAGATVAVNTSTYQAQSGGILRGNRELRSHGTRVHSWADGNSDRTAMPMDQRGTCTTAVTGGDWVYTVQVALTGSTPASQHIHGHPAVAPTGGAQRSVTVGTLQFTTPSTITPGETMNFIFDTGSTSFTAPAAIVITVQ